MPCTYCNGKYKFVTCQVLKTDKPIHISVNVFMCKKCGRFLTMDKDMKRKKIGHQRSSNSNGKIKSVKKMEQTEDEKKFYEILNKWNMTPREMRKYILDVEKKPHNPLESSRISKMSEDLKDYDKVEKL